MLMMERDDLERFATRRAVEKRDQALRAMPTRKTCGHFYHTPGCASCAYEQGRKVGHAEAGAVDRE